MAHHEGFIGAFLFLKAINTSMIDLVMLQLLKFFFYCSRKVETGDWIMCCHNACNKSVHIFTSKTFYLRMFKKA